MSDPVDPSIAFCPFRVSPPRVHDEEVKVVVVEFPEVGKSPTLQRKEGVDLTHSVHDYLDTSSDTSEE